MFRSAGIYRCETAVAFRTLQFIRIPAEPFYSHYQLISYVFGRDSMVLELCCVYLGMNVVGGLMVCMSVFRTVFRASGVIPIEHSTGRIGIYLHPCCGMISNLQ